MKTLLLTGFKPFLDHSSNPTEKIVAQLDQETIGGYYIQGKVLPVAFDESYQALAEAEKEIQPDAVLMLGLAAGRTNITPERIAINIQGGAVDNKGVTPEDEPIVTDGPAGYFSTLPIQAFVDALHKHQLPATISNTAGTYLCNKVMYCMLHDLEKRGSSLPAGFVHIPFSHEMSMGQSKQPSLAYRDLEEAVRIMIKTLSEKG
ncbi:pyroglutamyl-peptidase I [Alkalicoccobacillus porphyridii]|uniref:Pyrrolidone-carboxylate peptidase n=1 Tax=Alkalicoccobacillus porphyridii TaxID=2597270 RepID=A0A554A3U3_9BACI|nr:pyroglutamyl-peptidase I [Alkalicoccobacillus porphyridii]TSB48350.1 pyroglutamyl-peptidase I [Alkalicoccobacillus porphyridii]